MDYQLHQGEYMLGRYKIRFVHFTSLGWDTIGGWMRAIVTNRRLLFLPEDAYEVAPAAIDAADIARVWHVGLGNRDGLIVGLRGGQLIYMFVEWSQGTRLSRDIREMIAPPIQPRIHPRPLDRRMLQ